MPSQTYHTTHTTHQPQTCPIHETSTTLYTYHLLPKLSLTNINTSLCHLHHLIPTSSSHYTNLTQSPHTLSFVIDSGSQLVYNEGWTKCRPYAKQLRPPSHTHLLITPLSSYSPKP